jgi:putative DNA primase/helicase
MTPRKLSPLMGKMVNLLTELTSKAMVADGGFKTLVSTEEPLLIDPKFAQPILYAPIAKHVIACNSLPRVTDMSRGFFNRLMLLKFNRVIPEELRDRSIVDKLRREIEGIMSWAIEGARRLYENGGEFTRSGVRSGNHEYREEQNPVNMFVTECCDSSTKTSRIQSSYRPSPRSSATGQGRRTTSGRSQLCSGALVTRSTSARPVDRSG